jgi:hypothetical protein
MLLVSVAKVTHTEKDARPDIFDKGRSIVMSGEPLNEVPRADGAASYPLHESGENAAAVPAAATPEAAPSPAVPTPVVPSPAAASNGDQADPATTGRQTVYLTAPPEPIRRGNRGFGFLMAIVSTLVFTVLYGIVIAILESSRAPVVSFDFLSSIDFYVPAMFFFIGFLVLALVANRAGWWVYVFGSLLVGLFVYFGTVGVGLLSGGVILQTPDGASRLYGEALANLYAISAALLGREVALWLGSAVAARGRRIKARNADARQSFERDSAGSPQSVESDSVAGVRHNS